ncbi:MAG: hypothetical protein KIT79_08700 [Deltaproteobacteria bacterium]|nr:hypothetical protein [Deltaproteobacteria bacterium]
MEMGQVAMRAELTSAIGLRVLWIVLALSGCDRFRAKVVSCDYIDEKMCIEINIQSNVSGYFGFEEEKVEKYCSEDGGEFSPDDLCSRDDLIDVCLIENHPVLGEEGEDARRLGQVYYYEGFTGPEDHCADYDGKYGVVW